jgi:hypothetical protein
MRFAGNHPSLRSHNREAQSVPATAAEGRNLKEADADIATKNNVKDHGTNWVSLKFISTQDSTKRPQFAPYTPMH